MKRIVQPEILDTLSPADPRAIRSRRDLRRVNSWMGNAETLATALVKARPTSAFSQARLQITELGAGDGNFLLQVAEKINLPEVNATLLDRQKNVSDETLAAFSKFGWRAEAVVADAFDWPQIETEIVIANLFLHHFEDAELKELFRVIASRAKLFVAVEPHRFHFPFPCAQMLRFIGCGKITRHDAGASIAAGFVGREISALWPDTRNWQFTERRAGLFSHLFVAKKIE